MHSVRSIYMPVSPIEYRYGTTEMKAVFSEQRRMDFLLRCEGALALAQERLGLIPGGAGRSIHDRASLEHVPTERIAELERETRHEVMAIVKALSEVVEDDAGRFVHLGATSSDMLDSAMALQIREANSIIEGKLERLERAAADLAERGKDMLCIGRTHGQHAVPMTFGFKAGVWTMELRRQMDRLREVGKMSGAVGTGAAHGESSAELEEEVLTLLGLGIEEISTQIVQRDRYLEVVCFLANVSTTLEKIATEIRNLQRSEIAEAAESFDASRQVGSSTMAQKRNPITCENVCGLGRMVRAMVQPAMENAIQWHERDLSSSSSERFVISHSYVLLDDMLEKMISVLSNLSLHPDAMERNMGLSEGTCMAEAVMMAMVRKGIGRQDAHETVRSISLDCLERGVGLRDGMAGDGRTADLFTEGDLDDLFDPGNYLGHVRKKIDRYILNM